MHPYTSSRRLVGGTLAAGLVAGVLGLTAAQADAAPAIGLKGKTLIRIDDANGAFTTTIPTRIDGQGGNDAIRGGGGAERLNGDGGSDTIDGNGGDDPADLGGGDDRFVWDPGDGSDKVEGRGGD